MPVQGWQTRGRRSAGAQEGEREMCLQLVADKALKRRQVKLPVVVAQCPVFREGVEVLQRQLHRKSLQALSA